jgi:dTDP-4-amino-4,6-dideoxygalactose transaminase
MSAVGTVVPVYPTAAHFSRMPRASSSWRDAFPFSAPGGTWAFCGRAALYHGLPSLGLPKGSTILVPAYHQGVEIDTLLAAGYQLRYYRVTEQLEIDLDDVEFRLDDSVSALYVIHYFGFAQPLAPIRRFCDTRGLRLIEDCALSLFSRDNDTCVGSVGELALFSVYKTLPLPHGGYLVTRNAGRAGRLRRAPFASTLTQSMDLVHNGLKASRFVSVERGLARASRWFRAATGWNRDETISSGGALWDERLLGYAASPLSRALMRFVDPYDVIERRRTNYTRLAALLRGRFHLPFPHLPAGACPLFLPVMVPEKVRFQRRLASLGVESVNLWDASHPTCPASLAAEVSEWRRHCLELPIHQELSAEDIDRVGAAAVSVLTSFAATVRATAAAPVGV